MSRESDKNAPARPLRSLKTKDIGHGMNIESLNLGVYSVTISYLIRYDSLLQSATDFIAK